MYVRSCLRRLRSPLNVLVTAAACFGIGTGGTCSPTDFEPTPIKSLRLTVRTQVILAQRGSSDKMHGHIDIPVGRTAWDLEFLDDEGQLVGAIYEFHGSSASLEAVADPQSVLSVSTIREGPGHGVLHGEFQGNRPGQATVEFKLEETRDNYFGCGKGSRRYSYGYITVTVLEESAG